MSQANRRRQNTTAMIIPESEEEECLTNLITPQQQPTFLPIVPTSAESTLCCLVAEEPADLEPPEVRCRDPAWLRNGVGCVQRSVICGCPLLLPKSIVKARLLGPGAPGGAAAGSVGCTPDGATGDGSGAVLMSGELEATPATKKRDKKVLDQMLPYELVNFKYYSIFTW